MAEPLFFRRPKVRAPRRRKCPTPDLVAYRRQGAKSALRRSKRAPRTDIAPAHDRRAIWLCTAGHWHLTPRRIVKAGSDA